jgi:hypothetical protein
LLGVFVLSLLAVFPAAAQTTSCVPILREVMVSQGLGSYSPLVQGKDTLVKLFFTRPADCTERVWTDPGSGTTRTALIVSYGGTVLADLPPAKPLGEVWPEVGTGNASDPVFLIPAAKLRPVTDAFTVTLKATVNYKVRQNGTPTPQAYTSVSGSTAPLTANYNRYSNSLRILAVPMGDTTSSTSYSTQFPADAQAKLSQGMRTLSRIYPVPAGVEGLGATPAGITVPGIKYSLNPSMIHVGTGLWCGATTNLADVSTKLATALANWNSAPANVEGKADVALGVIDSRRTVASGSGCADGMAALDKPAAWVRVVAGADETSTQTGALIAMELAHTTKLVPYPRASAWHSSATEAETGGSRAYNVDTQTYITNDRTVTRVYPTWNDSVTLLELPDWQYEVCKLTPQGLTNVECPTAGVVGGQHLGHPMAVITGITDGTRPGTQVGESYVARHGTLPTQVDPSSQYRLYQKDMHGGELTYSGVPVAPDTSQHGDDDAVTGGAIGLFSVATRLDSKAARFELVNMATNPPTLLYATDGNLQPPSVGDVRFEPGPPENINSSGAEDEHAPALSDDGRLIAWLRDETLSSGWQPLYVAPVGDASAAALVPGCENACFDPAWSSDGRALVFVRPTVTGSSLELVRVDPARAPTEAGFFTDATTLYQDPDRLARPTWSRGDATDTDVSIAFEWHDIGSTANQLRALNPNVPNSPRDLTPVGENALMPSWSHTAGDDRLVYVRDGNTLVALDPVTDATEVLFTSAGPALSAPSWGTEGDIVFVQGVGSDSTLWRLDATTGGPPEQITLGFGGIEPSLAGATIVFEGITPNFETDLFKIDLQGRVKTEGTSTADPPDPAGLRLDVYLSCGPDSPDYPIANAETPVSTSGTTAAFGFDYDTSLACGGATAPTLRAVVNDGFHRSEPSAPVPIVSAPKRPVASISHPTVADVDPGGAYPYLQDGVIALLGSGSDPEDGELSGDALEWFLDDEPEPVVVGNSGALGIPGVGPHTLTLRVHDSDGNVAEAVRSFIVEADADHDGIPGSAEWCASDAIPEDAFADSDSDGLTNLNDYVMTGQPCLPTTNFVVRATFDPQILSATSNGRVVTVTLTRAPRPWSELDPATLRLHVAASTGCPALDLPVSVNGWQPGPDGATAKFDRQALLRHLVDFCRLHNQRVAYTVTGSSFPQFGPWKFQAHDFVQLS